MVGYRIHEQAAYRGCGIFSYDIGIFTYKKYFLVRDKTYGLSCNSFLTLHTAKALGFLLPATHN